MEIAFEYAQKGDVSQLSKILQNGMDINSLSSDKSNLLYYSILGNQINTTKFLIDNKIEINNRNEKGISPLHIACSNGNKEIVSLLLSNRADIFIKDNVSLYKNLFSMFIKK